MWYSLHWKWRDKIEKDWEGRIDRPFQVVEGAGMTGLMGVSLTDKKLKDRMWSLEQNNELVSGILQHSICLKWNDHAHPFLVLLVVHFLCTLPLLSFKIKMSYKSKIIASDFILYILKCTFSYTYIGKNRKIKCLKRSLKTKLILAYYRGLILPWPFIRGVCRKRDTCLL